MMLKSIFGHGVKQFTLRFETNYSYFYCRYYVLCKKAEQRVKNIQHLLIEWKRLEDFLEPVSPMDWDDFTPKQMVTFLKTYAMYYA